MHQASPVVVPNSPRKPRIILASQALPKETIAELSTRFDVLAFEPDTSQACPVLVTDPGCGASAEMMDSIEGLKLISLFGVGLDAVDLEAAAARGLLVTNTPGLLTDAVADHALALLLASARELINDDHYIRAGNWTSLFAKLPLGRGLKGKKLGIVGLGGIGSGIAVRAEAFGMRISYHGPRPKETAWRYVPDLKALAADSDYLVISCPGGKETEGLVDREVIEALGPQGTLVNVARGSVVDEPALVAALEGGQLGFAALDVFADEPNVPEPLLSLPNVVLTPHRGSATNATRIAMGELMIENVAAYFEGRDLPAPVRLP